MGEAGNFTLSCFLQLSVNQWVNGFLNRRFPLHYDDYPERESGGIPVFSLADTHTHTHAGTHIHTFQALQNPFRPLAVCMGNRPHPTN